MTETPLIHIVDDDESMRTSLLRLLGAAGFEARGYEVRLFRTGRKIGLRSYNLLMLAPTAVLSGGRWPATSAQRGPVR